MNRSISKIRHIQEANLRLEKRLLSEQSNNKPYWDLPEHPVCDYFTIVFKGHDGLLHSNFDLDAVYKTFGALSQDELNWKNAFNVTPWLYTKGLSIFPPGNHQKAYEAAKELYSGISGLDITGDGAKKIAHVGKMWETFDLPTQNEFLKQWYIISKGTETPWEAIVNDFENEVRNKMLEDSGEKVRNFCSAYTSKRKAFHDEQNNKPQAPW